MGTIFFISGNTPSSKNGKRKVGHGLINSKAVMKWYADTKADFMYQKQEFLSILGTLKMPYYIEFTFVRQTRHVFDYTNKADTVLDAMVYHGWLPDDSSDTVKPYYADYRYDKEKPGVEIRIIQNKPKHYENTI